MVSVSVYCFIIPLIPNNISNSGEMESIEICNLLVAVLPFGLFLFNYIMTLKQVLN